MNIEAFFSGDIEPYWPHFALIGVSLLGSAAVTWGLVRESEKFWALTNLLILSGVIIESICTILLFGFDEGITSAQQSKIIVLEKQLRPRTLDDQDQRNIVKAIKPYAGLPYALILPPVTNHELILQYLEAGSFLVNHLISTLATCEWQLKSIIGSIPSVALAPIYATQITHIQNHSLGTPAIFMIGQLSGISGVKIIFDNKRHPEWNKPVYALATSLNKALIWTDVVFSPTDIGIANSVITGDRVHIIIGTKF